VAVVRLSQSFRETLAALAEAHGVELFEAPSLAVMDPPSAAAAVLCLAGGEEAAGIELLRRRGGGPGCGVAVLPCYLVGADPDHRLAVAALQAGAADYFALPGDLDLVGRTLEGVGQAAAAAAAAARFAEAERSRHGFAAILGESPALRRVLGQARRVAKHADLTVLIGGETGTGKELLARAIHYEGPRQLGPFLEINCAAIPPLLLESELFGHERGAFTGAVQAKPGLFELANGGTVFLDEIGHLPLELQPKLLRVLETRSLRRVGGQRERRVDVRVIAATHVDLAAAVREGLFREDLYYRLHVVRLVLPPLRERDGDVEVLAAAFAARLAAAYDLPPPVLSPEIRAVLRTHSWPGNVRELRNAIERALVLSPPGTLLPEELVTAAPAAMPPPGPLPFPATLATLVRAAAREMVRRTRGNKSEAARRLGISRPRLQRLLEGDRPGSPDVFGETP
jgi:DNA-binding NtrC family response regulator